LDSLHNITSKSWISRQHEKDSQVSLSIMQSPNEEEEEEEDGGVRWNFYDGDEED
jgi:hypothetical protein